MRIGWCAPLARAQAVARLGFDYIEPQLSPLIGELGLAGAKAAVRASPLPTPVFGVILPYGLPTVGPEVKPDAIREHFGRAAEVLEAASAEVMVFGSGWGRVIPPGWPRADAETQFMDALGWAADAFAGAGVTIVVEPQNHTETNFINTVAEAVDIARRLEREAVRAMADFHHMVIEGEALDILTEAADGIAHVQLADTGRLTPGTGDYDYPGFARRLLASGYKGRISGEVMYDATEAEMAASLAFLRRTFG